MTTQIEDELGKWLSAALEDDSGSNAAVMLACVGVDNKQHVCEAHKKECACGVKVKRKKLLKNDHKLFSCYECTY